MDFAFTDDQLAIKDSVGKLCAQFDDKYWLKKDKEGGFPEDFYQAMADAGWLGIAMPEEYGGAGLGITEAAIMMQAVAESGAGPAGRLGDPHEHLRAQPGRGVRHRGAEAAHPARIITGKDKGCFAVTEPDAGLNTTALKTKAERDGNGYVVHGKKIWISTAQVADKMLLIARTTPQDKCKRPTDGLTLFYTDLDRRKVEVREIDKMGRKAVDSNQVFIDGLQGAARGPHRRGGQGLPVHPARPEPRAHPDRRRGDRHRPRGARRAPRNTPRSASCSAGRSARTRRSSIRSPRAGWSSRPPT